jgi:hypothetical protein
MTRSARGTVAAFAGVLALAVPGAAQADTKRLNTTLNAATPAFAWEGTGSGASMYGFNNPVDDSALVPPTDTNCEDPAHCEEVLINLEAKGDLYVSVEMDEPITDPLIGFLAYPDFDVYLYKSNDKGEVAEDAEPVGSAATIAGKEEFTVKNLEPGFYLLKVNPFEAFEDAYKGEAKLSNIAAGEPTPEPQATSTPEPAASPSPAPEQPQQPAAQPQQQPQQQPAGEPAASKKKKKPVAACKAKAKKVKNAKKRKAAMKRCAKKSKKR